MTLSHHEFWTVLHGMVFGAIYLLAFAGGFASLWSLRPEFITEVGLRERLRRLRVAVWAMALMSWATVVTGTYIVYPWYRAATPGSPRSKLLAEPAKAAWHTFGMEWKEHIAWPSAILVTAVAFIVTYYGVDLLRRQELRKAALVLFILAFLMAGVAGVFGAFLNKVAPIL